ncbi:MAG: hypothetical protein EXR52_02970 [Dehalococcoidia bacterium]|nr:hypothetical protein [Dehalococcoidia bacterium]
MTQILSCTVIEKLLNPYLDGELSPPERATVEHHVAGCRTCRQAFVALERTALALEALPRLAAPAALLASTMAAVRREERKRAASDSWQPVATVAVVLLAVLGMSAAVMAGGESLLASLDAALEDPATLLENLALLGTHAELITVLGSSALLVAGALAFAQLMRGEFTTRVAR